MSIANSSSSLSQPANPSGQPSKARTETRNTVSRDRVPSGPVEGFSAR